MSLDLSLLFSSFSDDAPSGPNLEYDPAFLEMMEAAEAKPERQMGDSVIEAEEPDWKVVKARALDLCQRSKDLRVLILLAQAALHTDGFPATGQALEAVQRVLSDAWDSVHPQLDPDDQDPMMRVNAIAALADPAGLIKSLRAVPLVSSRVVGRFALRDIHRAESGGGAEGGPSADLISAAFMDVDLEELQSTEAALRGAKDAAAAIDADLTERLGGQAPDLQPLVAMLEQCAGEVLSRLASRGAAVEVDVEPGAPAAAPTAAAAPAAAVNGRQDVVRMIDLICDYYRRSEPSSPVPVLLGRARKLVDMSFLDVVRDLVPGGLDEAERFRGEVEEQEDS